MVRLTDRLDMTIAVAWDAKLQTKQNKFTQPIKVQMMNNIHIITAFLCLNILWDKNYISCLYTIRSHYNGERYNRIFEIL